MVELYSFEAAKYLSQLSHLLSSFDRLKQIMICSKDNYAEPEPQESRTRKRNCSLDIPNFNRIINIKKPKSVSQPLSFNKYLSLCIDDKNIFSVSIRYDVRDVGLPRPATPLPAISRGWRGGGVNHFASG